jgi:hypothetical protein
VTQRSIRSLRAQLLLVADRLLAHNVVSEEISGQPPHVAQPGKSSFEQIMSGCGVDSSIANRSKPRLVVQMMICRSIRLDCLVSKGTGRGAFWSEAFCRRCGVQQKQQPSVDRFLWVPWGEHNAARASEHRPLCGAVPTCGRLSPTELSLVQARHISGETNPSRRRPPVLHCRESGDGAAHLEWQLCCHWRRESGFSRALPGHTWGCR